MEIGQMVETVSLPVRMDGSRLIRERIADIAETRVTDPEAIHRAALTRVKRPTVRGNGRLMLLAADHPGRGAFRVGNRAMAMGSRIDLLDRLVTALGRPGVDGLLGTPDVLEDLLLLGALHDKVVIGSMNRGGLQGAAFEFDDRFTGYDARGCADMAFNGGKMLVRIALGDPGTVATMTATAQAINELANYKLIAMVEPFWSTRSSGKVTNDLTPDAVIKSIGVTTGLGRTSAYTWLKIPVVPDMARVMDATTLPTLLLGGDPATTPDKTFRNWSEALTLPGVRGLVVGRTLLYPPDDDVAGAVDIAVSMVG